MKSNNNKVVIYLEGEANSGKTTIIRKAYIILKLLGFKDIPNLVYGKNSLPDKHKTNIYKGDILAVLSNNKNLKIGISSIGDPYPEHKEKLEFLDKQNCDIIICCACRHKLNFEKFIKSGDCYTYGNIINVFHENKGYKVYGFFLHKMKNNSNCIQENKKNIKILFSIIKHNI